MLETLLPELLQEHRRLLEGELPPEARHLLEENLLSLQLAEAFLLKKGWGRLPLQVAVVGPTQVGKSTLVNLLLKKPLASVSPLAGWTVHPTAFLEGGAELLPFLEALFPGRRVVPQEHLSREALDQVGLASLPGSQKRVLWDTPDFDSVRSRRYLESVLRVAGIADLMVLVVSREKYADESVWRFLELVAPLGQPLLVCLNKVRPGEEALLEAAFRRLWEGRFGRRPFRLLTLPYCEGGAPPGEALRQAVAAMGRPRWRPGRIEKALLERFRERWEEPRKRREELARLWEAWLEEASREAVALYRRDFLDQVHLYDTLQRVMAELLVLLELPGVARPMFYFRRALTWPIRQLLSQKPKESQSPEISVLRRAGDQFLLALQKRLLAHKPHPLVEPAFRRLQERFQKGQAGLRSRFERAIGEYYAAFQPQVEQTARELYQKLKERPALLGSLRASRAFADAAALALAVQTSGIGPHDLVVAPALLAMTSLLTEGALGKFLDQKVARLKSRQLAQVTRLFQDHLKGPLFELSERFPEHRQERRYGLFLLRS